MKNQSEFDGLLPKLTGLNPKDETELYMGFRRMYEFFTQKLDDQQKEFDRRLLAATQTTSKNLNDLIGVFSQPLAGSSTSDPLLDSLIQNFGSQSANHVFIAPDGVAGNPLFRLLVAADIPSLSAAKITSGILALVRLDTKILKTDDALAKTIAAAPYANDGFITVKDNNGNSVKVGTVA